MNQLKDMLTNDEKIDVNMKESVYGGTALHYAASSVEMMLGLKTEATTTMAKTYHQSPTCVTWEAT